VKAVIWSTENCGYCRKAKELLAANNIPFEERLIGQQWSKEELLQEVPNARTVPQIFLDGNYVGGYTDLVSYLSSL
jgi:glutaredoxin